MNTEVEIIGIHNETDVAYYAERITKGAKIAIGFEFDNDELYAHFLVAIGLEPRTFQSKSYFFDKEKTLHISESEKGYLWVSTMGLVAKSKTTDNKYVNACSSQAVVLKMLLDEAIVLSQNENSYNVDSYSYSMIETLTPSLFHNIIFYYEILAKAYLSLNNITFSRTHKINHLSELVRSTMFEKGHNNTLFHAQVITKLEQLAKHISYIPGAFNEAFVKYDDNPEDITIIEFCAEQFRELRDFVDLSCEIIWDLYYEPDKCGFMRPGLFQRLLDKCESEEAKKSMQELYGFLMDQK